MALYTETVMDHFMHPRNVGEIENADGVGQVFIKRLLRQKKFFCGFHGQISQNGLCAKYTLPAETHNKNYLFHHNC